MNLSPGGDRQVSRLLSPRRMQVTMRVSKGCVHAQLLSHSQLFMALDCNRQAPLSTGLSRQEHWRGCHAFLQGSFPSQGSKPNFLRCRWIFIHQTMWESLNKGALGSKWEGNPSQYVRGRGQGILSGRRDVQAKTRRTRS